MKELLFVYNADSGLANGLLDSLHKIVSPDTYQCQLCSITYGLVGMKKTWKTILDSLQIPTRFLHRDEFLAAHPGRKIQFPSVWLIEGETWTEILGKDDWQDLKSPEDLGLALGKSLLRKEAGA